MAVIITIYDTFTYQKRATTFEIACEPKQRGLMATQTHCVQQRVENNGNLEWEQMAANRQLQRERATTTTTTEINNQKHETIVK